jgi:hypothetical protein
MFFALILTLIAIMGGTLATYLYDEGVPVGARLCAGACTGLTALGLLGFVCASFLGMTPLALVLAAGAVASPLLLLLKPERRREVLADLSLAVTGVRRAVLRPTWERSAYFLFYAFVAVVLWVVFDRAMFEQADGIYTGAVNNYGDLPFHLSVITSFAYGGNFPPEDPTYAGARFTYPFLSDFVAAMFVRAGASLREAMFLEGIVLSLAFVGLLHRWAWELVRDRAAALLTPVLVLLSGGLGWVLLFSEGQETRQGILLMLANLPHDYTIIPETAWRWPNALASLLIPQRGMLLGLPLAIIVFTQWWTSLEEGKRQKVKGKSIKETKGKQRRREGKAIEVAAPATPSLLPFTFLLLPSARRMIAAGVVAGLLPLAHAHSFVVVMVVGAGVALLLGRERWREWAAFFVVASVVAAPQLWLATHGSSVRSGTFIGWHLSWDRGEENVLWFWFKNTGLFIPLVVAALLWRDGDSYLVSRRLVRFYLPFMLCFIIPNLVKLAPWVWDNIKVLFYWYIASAPLVALVLVRLWRRSGGAMYRALAGALFVSLTLAGALDIWRIVSKTTEYREFDRDGIAFAEMIKQKTAARSLILHAPTFNHPVFLTGRRSLMGYPGHIWTHGLDYKPREAEIKQMYEGRGEELLTRYGVEYVVISPLDQSQLRVNEPFFERYMKVGEVGQYRLYKITRQ